jgi:hypothetical protein
VQEHTSARALAAAGLRGDNDPPRFPIVGGMRSAIMMARLIVGIDLNGRLSDLEPVDPIGRSPLELLPPVRAPAPRPNRHVCRRRLRLAGLRLFRRRIERSGRPGPAAARAILSPS